MDTPRIITGDTLELLLRVPGYPASEGWTLAYRLVPRSGSGSAIQFTSTAEAELHRVTVPAATTAAWAIGTYAWAAYVTNGAGASHTWRTGSVELLPNPRTSTAPLDLRTPAEIALAAAESALASWTPTTRSYTIAGRSMTFSAPEEILPIISYWKMAVQRERRAAALRQGMPDPRKSYVRLGRV